MSSRALQKHRAQEATESCMCTLLHRYLSVYLCMAGSKLKVELCLIEWLFYVGSYIIYSVH